TYRATLGESRMSTGRRARTVLTTFCRMEPMDKKAAPERPPTLRAGCPDVARGEEGFTLLEVVCVLAIVAVLAAVLMPHVPSSTTRPRLEAYALETAALLKIDKTAALVRRVQISTEVDARSRLIRSGANGRAVRYPDDVTVDAVLPELCNRRRTM